MSVVGIGGMNKPIENCFKVQFGPGKCLTRGHLWISMCRDAGVSGKKCCRAGSTGKSHFFLATTKWCFPVDPALTTPSFFSGLIKICLCGLACDILLLFWIPRQAIANRNVFQVTIEGKCQWRHNIRVLRVTIDCNSPGCYNWGMDFTIEVYCTINV